MSLTNGPSPSGRLTPYQLTCERRTTPLGIDEPHPRLSWQVADPRPEQAQTAYRLTVSAGGALVHDSGTVADARTLDVVPEGLTLRAATRYHWTVTVWDADGAEGATASSWFETGLLGPLGWSPAAWIEQDPAGAPAVRLPVSPAAQEPLPERLSHCPPALRFRRVFTARETPVRARLYATARGLYRPFLDGARIGDGELLPGWTDYRHRVQYQTYDVTNRIRPGENVLEALVAPGWWSGYVGFDPRRHAEHYGARPQFVARLDLEYADGGHESVVTDGSWQQAESATIHTDLLMGEVRDARIGDPTNDPVPDARIGDPAGEPAWRPVRIAGTGLSTLVGMLDEPVRVLEDVEPVRVGPLPGRRLLLDMGQNMVGRVRLTVRRAPAGTRIALRHAEVLDRDGELYVDNLRTAEATDVYVTAGHAEEVFEPAFTVHGFRFVEVSGWTDVRAVGRVMHSDTPFTGTFVCSDPDVNALWSNIRWGQRGNFVSVPTDCPQRDERLGWLADAQVFLPTACYNADVSAFFARWILDVLDGCSAEGAFPDVAPVLDRAVLSREGAPGWGDAGVLIPWQLYRGYGDRRTLDRALPYMARWIDWIAAGNPDLIWRHRVGNHYGDWLQVGVETPREVLATAYFAHSTAVVARAARVLGRDGLADRYAALAERVRQAFRAAFVTDGAVRGETQTGYLLALAFDLLPPDQVPAAVARLVALIEANGDRLTTGFIGVSLLCPVLTRYGRADVAYRLLQQRDHPSWLYSLRHGATTVWERWDGYTEDAGFQSPGMNSFNHYALGAVGEWLYATVAGIAQHEDSVAYERLVIAPVPGGTLTSAAGRFLSPRGPVTTAWRLADGLFTLDVGIPPGVRATVRLPGRPDAVEVGSGSHRFTIPAP